MPYAQSGELEIFCDVAGDATDPPELLVAILDRLQIDRAQVVGVSMGGRASQRMAIADAVPDAKLVSFPTMGHDVPPQLWPLVRDELVQHFSAHPVREPPLLP